MSIQEECSVSGATQSFEATFASYVAGNSALWSLNDGIPALDQVRGGNILLRRVRANASPFPSGKFKVKSHDNRD